MSILACARVLGTAGLWLALVTSASADPALFDAVTRNDVAGVRAALLAGADVNARQEHGRTALHEAARAGHSEVAALLLAAGADIEATNPAGLTPLHVAALWGYWDTTDLLLANCADVDATNRDLSTPLHLAAAAGNREVAALLLTHGAEVNAQRRGRVTPLGVAVNHRHWDVADLLRSRSGLIDAARVGAAAGELPEVGAVPPQDLREPARELWSSPRDGVEHVQEMLAELGYDPGPIDGRLGERTVESIRSFQAEIRQVVTGEIGACLVSQLEASVRERVEQTGPSASGASNGAAAAARPPRE